VLVVGGVLVWAQVRPVGPADYRTASSRLTSLTEALEPLQTRQAQMMDLGLLPTPEQIERAAQAQRDQLATFTDAVTGYGSTRALRDPDLKRTYDTLVTDTDTRLGPMVDDFVDHYAAVLQMVQVCAAYDAQVPSRPGDDTNQAWFDSRIVGCEQATRAASASTTFAPLVAVRQQHITDSRAAYQAYGTAVASGSLADRVGAQRAIQQAQNGIGTRNADALAAVGRANDEVFAAITGGIESIRTHCDERG